MENLLIIPFVLLVFAALFLCDLLARRPSAQVSRIEDTDRPDLQGQPRAKSLKQRVNAYVKRNLGLVSGLFFLFCAIALYVGISVYVEASVDNYLIYVKDLSYPLVNIEKPWMLKYSGVLVNVGLALIYGFLLYRFIKFLKKYDDGPSQPSKVAVVLWILVLVLVPAFGLFKTEAKLLLASIKRLETPAGAIEFSAISDESQISLYFDDRAPTETITNFQAGAQRLAAALGYAQTDFENIVKFCKTESNDGPFCAPRLGGSDTETAREREKLMSAMAVTYGYANAIKPVAACLNAYACFYENGVPIQDDLSEIAASYAAPPSVPLGCPDRGKMDPVCVPVDRIIDHLEVFRNQDWGEAAKDQCKYLAQCLDKKNKLPTAEDVMSHRDAVLATGNVNNAGVAEKTRETGFILPYRSMLSAALLTASGYPAEAVGHMERQYLRLMRKFGRNEGGGKETPAPDFVESVLRLRLLFALQQAGEHANNQSLKLKYQDMERDLARAHLEFNIGVDGYQREQLLAECAAGSSGFSAKLSRPERNNQHVRFVDWLEAFPKSKELNFENMEKSESRENRKSSQIDTNITNAKFEKNKIIVDSFDSVEEKIKTEPQFHDEKWEKYKRDFILYFVNADFLRLHSISRQGNLTITGADLLDTQEWWRIATEKPYLIEKCFSHLPDEYIEYLRFHMVYAFGLLHAQKAQRLSQTAELIRSGFTATGSIPVDMHEVEGVACMGYTGLRRAYAIGKGLAEMDPGWGNAIADEMQQAPSMLRHLAKYLASAGASCLH